MRRDASRDTDDTTVRDPDWWATVGGDGPSPYATAAWQYFQTVVEEETSCEPTPQDDQDDLECEVELPWWETIGGEGPKPYATAAWTYEQTVEVEEEVEEAEVTSLAPTPQVEWWETIGGDGPKPYATASWQYYQQFSEIEEFVPVSRKLFLNFDEEYYPRLSGLGIVLDSGYFGQPGPREVYDSAFYLGDLRGILMKRKFARVYVYDSLASSPGVLPLIPQGLGIISTDPGNGNPLETDPLGQDIGAEASGTLTATINADTGPVVSDEIACDGSLDGVLLEAARPSNKSDDRPPGTLLGSVSYELFNDVITITDWEHLNWMDDAPVRKAVQVILNDMPPCVKEVKVLDPPHAFWTALGFKVNFKGDSYVHFYPR
jgi:hypothetical protein